VSTAGHTSRSALTQGGTPATPTAANSAGSRPQPPAAPTGAAPRSGAAAPGTRPTGPVPGIRQRRVKLTVSRVDPWSAMKMSFLISVALGIAGVVMVAVLWMILSGMGVFSEVNRLVGTIFTDAENPFNIMDFLGFGRVVSLSIVIGVIDVILLTALSTLGAFLYNICSSLVGGIQLTLTDD
jgi:hypothetical protein